MCKSRHDDTIDYEYDHGEMGITLDWVISVDDQQNDYYRWSL